MLNTIRWKITTWLMSKSDEAANTLTFEGSLRALRLTLLVFFFMPRDRRGDAFRSQVQEAIVAQIGGTELEP